MTSQEKNLAVTIAKMTYQRPQGQSKASAFRKACKWFDVFDNVELQNYALDYLHKTQEAIESRTNPTPHPWHVI